MSRERHEGDSPAILAAFALVHVVLFAVVYQTIYIVGYSGIGLYFADVSRLFARQVPYRDFVLEYPPFAIVFFALPRFFASSYLGYYRGFQAEIIVCDLLILAMLDAIARARGERRALLLGAYTVFTLAVGPIAGQQFDLFPAAMTLLAVYFAARSRRAPVWILLALGTLTKLYPLLLAPVFLLRDVRRRDWRAIGQAVALGAATIVVVMLPLFIVAPTAIRSFFAYHAKRGLQIESTYAGWLLVVDNLRLIYLGISNSFGSWNVTGQYADFVAALSTIVFVAALGGAYLWLARELPIRPAQQELDPARLYGIIAAAVLVVVFTILVTSKVFSPQYLIWALPLVPLVDGKHRRTIWGLYTLAGVMTYYIFPTHYGQLINADDGAVITMLVIRNLLVLVLGLLAAAAVRDSVRAAAGNAGDTSTAPTPA